MVLSCVALLGVALVADFLWAYSNSASSSLVWSGNLDRSLERLAGAGDLAAGSAVSLRFSFLMLSSLDFRCVFFSRPFFIRLVTIFRAFILKMLSESDDKCLLLLDNCKRGREVKVFVGMLTMASR